MEIRTLKYFVTIVNEKTMTSAAETLHLSQSALSKQIQLLEDELGKKLFHRDKNRLCLTDAGKFLYQRSEKILEIADTTKNYIMMYDEAALDDISLCIGEAKKLELISKTIGLMHKKYPNVKFHIHCCDSIEALERMQNDKCDFIFIPYIDHDIKSLYSNMLLPLRSAWGYLISKNSPLAAMDGMRFPDIKNIPLLVPESFFNDRASLDWMRNFTEDMNIIGTYNTISGCCDLINENRCIALAHCFSADSYEDADLCFHQILPTSSYMIWKNNASLSLSARIFMSYFEEVACEKAAENTTVG